MCATRSKCPLGPAVESGTIHRCQWQGRESFRRPYGSAHFGPGWPSVPTTPIDTRADNSPVGFERGQNIVGKRRGGRSAPTTVNSSGGEDVDGEPVGAAVLKFGFGHPGPFCHVPRP